MQATPTSTTRRIFRAAAVISLSTFAIRLAGLVKSQVIAARFGVGDAIDAFFLAAVLPTFAFGALGSTLPSALVPLVVSARSGGGRQRAERLLRDVYAWSLAVLLAATALLALGWPLFLATAGADFPPDKAALATELFYLLLPIVPMHGAATVLGAVLKSDKRFLAATLAPGAVPVGVTLAVLVGSRSWGVVALSLGHVLGVGIELLIVARALRRGGGPILPVPRLRRTEELRALAGQYLPAVGGGLLFASTLLVDQSMAARLGEGSLATLGYANALTTALLSIVTTALGTAILPYLSDMAARGDRAHVRASLRASIRAVLLLATPAALVLALGASLVVRVVFQRGAFGAAETAAVGGVFALYVLQLPFYTTEVLCSRALSALRLNRLVFFGAAWNLGLNVVLNLVLLRWIGVRGIALATSVTHLVVAAGLWIAVERRLAAAAASPDRAAPGEKPTPPW